MKRYIILLIVMLFIGCQPSYSSCLIKYDYDEDQWDVIQYSYDKGSKVGYGYTLAAISIIESSAGKNIANWNEASFGVYQNRAKSVLNRLKIPSDDVILQFRVAERLIYDIGFASTQALSELEYWAKIRDKNWMEVWASYNAGWKMENGIEYANKVKGTITKLRGCV